MILLYRGFVTNVLPALSQLATPIGAIIITIIGIGIALSCIGISFSLSGFADGLFRGFGRAIAGIARGLIRFMRLLIVVMTPRLYRSVRRFFNNIGMRDVFARLFATITVIIIWTLIII